MRRKMRIFVSAWVVFFMLAFGSFVYAEDSGADEKVMRDFGISLYALEGEWVQVSHEGDGHIGKLEITVSHLRSTVLAKFSFGDLSGYETPDDKFNFVINEQLTSAPIPLNNWHTSKTVTRELVSHQYGIFYQNFRSGGVTETSRKTLWSVAPTALLTLHWSSSSRDSLKLHFVERKIGTVTWPSNPLLESDLSIQASPTIEYRDIKKGNFVFQRM